MATTHEPKAMLIASSDATGPNLQPYPFFYYRDYSGVRDHNPSTRNSLKGANNFPVKMHIILSDPNLEDIVGWCAHGRSWRILRPKEFEDKVIPAFFEHTKFSSFIRQANGWGFRRVIQGRDRGSYYHEMFLRGVPHLCKKMKRPGKAMKITIDSDHEPDLYKISEMCPLPDNAQHENRTTVPPVPTRVQKEAVGSGKFQPALDTLVNLPTCGSAFAKPQQGQGPSNASPQPSLSVASQTLPGSLVGGNISSELLVLLLKACQEGKVGQPPAPAPPAAPLLPASSAATVAGEQMTNELLLALLTGAPAPTPTPPPAPTVRLSLPAPSLASTVSGSHALAPATPDPSQLNLVLQALSQIAAPRSFLGQFHG